MSNIKLFKPIENYELLQQMNAVQNTVILQLQEKNESLQQKIQHLEKMLMSMEGLHIDNTTGIKST